MPLVNQIDIFTFEDLQQNVPSRAERLEVFERMGYNGVGARRTGFRTGPIKMTSIRYTQSWTTARNILVSYQDLIGLDPVRIIHHDLFLGFFLIEDVQELSTIAVVSAGGTIETNPQTLLTCEWTLRG